MITRTSEVVAVQFWGWDDGSSIERDFPEIYASKTARKIYKNSVNECEEETRRFKQYHKSS